MKRFTLASAIAAGILVFTAPGIAQVSGSTPGFQTPGFNSNAGTKGKRNGPNDGTGNQGQRPQDGTGYGAKSGKKGSGTCDGTGPKGQASRGRGSTGGRGGGRR
jgi:hypothetical protein